MNKEDIWISRIPVPVNGKVDGPVVDDFNQMESGGVVTDWSIYSPSWCPIEVSKFPNTSEQVLTLRDFDPYDYAKAVRVFKKTDQLTIQFKLYVEANPEILAIEVVSAKGSRCVQIQLDQDGSLLAKMGDNALSKVSEFTTQKWMQVKIDIDAEKQQYHLKIDEKIIAKKIKFAATGKPERILFRTGVYRLQNDVQKYKSGDKNIAGWDEPGADEPAAEAVFHLKEFTVQAQ